MEQPLQSILIRLKQAYPDHQCLQQIEEGLTALRGGDLRQACRLVNQALQSITDSGIELPPALVEWEKLYCGIE